MYNPHENPDLIGERSVMDKGRLVKARLADQPAPNVDWYWFPVGNCQLCKYLDRKSPPKCTNPKISQEDYRNNYTYTNTCPGYSLEGNPANTDALDVMKAVGLVKGKPGQTVTVLADMPWSIDTAIRAHREQSVFLHMAMQADRGAANDPSWGEYVDLSDDLERATAPKAP